MRIIEMTATFGKLSHQSLTLQPGMNVIHAPNEWGKSTWCAFLVAMLYGIDTKERTTKEGLADKEHYKPWSGEEMSGRMEIVWKGRNITLERRSKGRIPMGHFSAYETETGLPIEELTGENCGQMLLGVEKSVFTRSAFLRLTDLPVTQDEALRRRLNALVTTGDESGASDALAQKLKDLKNRCRYNKSGLLPQAETQQADLLNKLNTLRQLQEQTRKIEDRRQALSEERKALENHREALAFAESQAVAERVSQAKAACSQAEQNVAALENACKDLPELWDAEKHLQQLQQLRLQQETLLQEAITEKAAAPAAPEIFANLSPEEALRQASSDKAACDALSKPTNPILLMISAVLILAGIVLVWKTALAAIVLFVLGGLMLPIYLYNKSGKQNKLTALKNRYPGLDSALWVATAQKYKADMDSYLQNTAVQTALEKDLARRKDALSQQILEKTQGLSLEESISQCKSAISQRQALADAKSQWTQAKNRAAELSALVKTVLPPAYPDTLTLTGEQTQARLIAVQAEEQQLQQKLGLFQGQMEALGQEALLTQQLTQVQNRISRLEEVYAATELAMQTLSAASQELQRRFAPRISQKAQSLFAKLTNNRYDRLQLTQSLALQTGAAGENTLWDAQWRSDGTIDQLYLALRLAVAGELTPEAPLVLDDALVRFDDDRLALAMEILKEESQNKQVILFTCQQREVNYQSPGIE